MPFILEHNPAGIARPRFQCDKCRALITDARGAMLLWDTETHRRNEIVIPTIVCYECDDTRDPALPFSMNLETALIFLLANCGITEKRIKESRDFVAIRHHEMPP
jgi:hypothetical protein